MVQAIDNTAFNRYKRASDVKREWDNWASRSHPDLDYTTMYGPALAEQDSLLAQRERDMARADANRKWQSEFDMQQKAYNDAAAAAQVTGYTQMGATALLAAPSLKSGATWTGQKLGLLGRSQQITSSGGYAPQFTGSAPAAAPAVDAIPAIAPESVGAGGSGTASVAGQQTAALAPEYGGTVTDIGYGAVATPASSSAPVATTVAPSAMGAYEGVTAEAALAGTEGGGVATIGGEAGASMTGGEALSAVAPYAGVAAAGYGGYQIGESLYGREGTGPSKRAGIAGATAAGAVVGSYFGGVGALPGAAIGFVVGVYQAYGRAWIHKGTHGVEDAGKAVARGAKKAGKAIGAPWRKF